jgi:hypothetical protein
MPAVDDAVRAAADAALDAFARRMLVEFAAAYGVP